MKTVTVVKWIGSKWSQSEQIIKYFPKKINTYYEPFCGGCSVLIRILMNYEKMGFNIQRFICSDINPDLINLWNTIKTKPKTIMKAYETMWWHMARIDERQDKRKYFEDVRATFNETKDPLLYFFLLRTCTNGVPRYNKNLEFNNTFHITRDGAQPDYLGKKVLELSSLLKKYNVEFVCCNYKDVFKVVKADDFMYLDPPYANTRDTGKYFGGVNYRHLFSSLHKLKNLKYKYAISYDGISGKNESVPEECYDLRVDVEGSNGGYWKTQSIKGDYSSGSLYVSYGD